MPPLLMLPISERYADDMCGVLIAILKFIITIIRRPYCSTVETFKFRKRNNTIKFEKKDKA